MGSGGGRGGRGEGRTAGTRGLRYGILASSRTWPRWQARCLEELDAVAGARLELFILGDALFDAPDAGKGLWRRVEDGLLDGDAGADPVDLSFRLANAPTLRCARPDPSTPGRLREDDVERIRGRDLDFILHLGEDALRGPILRVPRYGVWTFRYGDPTRYPAGPVGFWEILHDDPVTVGVLARLTGDPGGVRVLHRCRLGTVKDSLSQNREQILMASADWAPRVCREILATGRAPNPVTPPSRQVVGPEEPGVGQTLRFLRRLGGNYLAGVADELLHHEDWGLGLVPHHPEVFLEKSRGVWVRWLDTAPENRYWADPFGVPDGDGVRIIAEEFDHEEHLGRLVSLRAGSGGVTTRTRPVGPPSPLRRMSADALGGIPAADDGPVHTSYPYLFTHDGDTYCVPETCAIRATRLYRAVRFPDEWELVTTLVDDFPLVDPTVFRFEDRWWLLGTDLDRGSHSHLHAWWADDLCGPWHRHVLNPLKTDVRSSRPAGTPFWYHGSLFRPAQDCARTYGGGIALNRVVELTPTTFHEGTVSYLKPDPDGPYPDGLHTLSMVGDWTLVDGKRSVFIPALFRRRLLKRLEGRFRRFLPGRFRKPGQEAPEGAPESDAVSRPRPRTPRRGGGSVAGPAPTPERERTRSTR